MIGWVAWWSGRAVPLNRCTSGAPMAADGVLRSLHRTMATAVATRPGRPLAPLAARPGGGAATTDRPPRRPRRFGHALDIQHIAQPAVGNLRDHPGMARSRRARGGQDTGVRRPRRPRLLSSGPISERASVSGCSTEVGECHRTSPSGGIAGALGIQGPPAHRPVQLSDFGSGAEHRIRHPGLPVEARLYRMTTVAVSRSPIPVS